MRFLSYGILHFFLTHATTVGTLISHFDSRKRLTFSQKIHDVSEMYVVKQDKYKFSDLTQSLAILLLRILGVGERSR